MSKGLTDEARNQVTVLVFKDNYSARTFHVPLPWLSRLGFLLGAFTVITLATTFLAVRFYWTAKNSSPTRVTALQIELDQLRESYEVLEKRAATLPPLAAEATDSSSTAQAESSAPDATASTGMPARLFVTVPPSLNMTPKAPQDLPIELVNTNIGWRGNSLTVKFGIRHKSGHGEQQQGRILIFARSPDTLSAYPRGVMNRAGTQSLIDPLKGEYFSVSRFRQTDAEFTHAPRDIQDVEVLIFDTSGDLLLIERFPANDRTGGANAKALPPAGASEPVTTAPPAADKTNKTRPTPTQSSAPEASGSVQPSLPAAAPAETITSSPPAPETSP